MELLIDSGGHVRCLYEETIDLHQIGSLTISRGSHVEPTSVLDLYDTARLRHPMANGWSISPR